MIRDHLLICHDIDEEVMKGEEDKTFSYSSEMCSCHFISFGLQ